jgi:hypothetical protein
MLQHEDCNVTTPFVSLFYTSHEYSRDGNEGILAGNADPMETARRRSSQYAPPCLKNLQPSQSQDNQEHKILPLLL